MERPSQNIICISTIDWDFIWQGHQEIMSTLARQGHRVLFIENTGVRAATLLDLPRLKSRLRNWRKGVNGIRKVMDNLYVYSPVVLPFPHSRIARYINKAIMTLTLNRWIKTVRFVSPIVWTWLPTALALELIGALDAQLVVYYCVDNFEASTAGGKQIRKTEEILIRRADLVFAHSKGLFDRCSRLASEVHIFQYGFNRDIFAQAGDRLPDDLEGITHPVLGYVGGVHKVVDFDLVKVVALAHPDKSLVFVGPLQTDVHGLASLPNVHFLGRKQYYELPTYIRHFDLCLIPYVLNDYTRYVYPNKLNEYLIMGKPVVSTRIPEVEHFNQCHQHIVSVAYDHEAFVRLIQENLDQDCEALRAKRIALVENNAWDRKIEAMQGLIRAKLEEKDKIREQTWQQTLVQFYRSTRRKAAAVVAVCALGYFLIFHTPLVWWLAKPLLIVEEPVPADAIAVLAGGIGESGEPSEFYQEKVKGAVALYNRGCAPNLIFSSGVSRAFNEARVMRALAVSLGVPEHAIVLDELGGGNYQSLMTLKSTMTEHGWTRVLLVTSLYNGMRSRLVAEKNMHGAVVRIVPSKDGNFFGDQSRVARKHVRAIAHEYLAILYYWWKGYI
jgi:glycosyltransferase involved in cell wall biosynthesis/vancomycin permeability regulator SanA